MKLFLTLIFLSTLIVFSINSIACCVCMICGTEESQAQKKLITEETLCLDKMVKTD